MSQFIILLKNKISLMKEQNIRKVSAKMSSRILNRRKLRLNLKGDFKNFFKKIWIAVSDRSSADMSNKDFLKIRKSQF
jgi:hypothetical protein